MELHFTLNGQLVTLRTDPLRRLLDILREDFGLTATKEGCGEGECGACTVLLDGHPVTACLMNAGSLLGHRIETVESLSATALGQRIVAAFEDTAAVQCGFCFPGILVSAWYYLQHHPEPSEAGVRAALSGNLCRCTGYEKIVEAVLLAGENA